MDELFWIYHYDIVVNIAAQAGVRYNIYHPENLLDYFSTLQEELVRAGVPLTHYVL